jgi:protein-S-isoprenylcysteine O-methyltransferase
MRNLFYATFAGWGVAELILGTFMRARGGEKRDRRSIVIIFAGITVAAVLAGGLRHYAPTAFASPYALAIALIAAGFALRLIAMRTLKQHFTYDVALRDDHQLVQRGVYGVLRHPSYTGTLLCVTGGGIGFGNWLSVLVLTGIGMAVFAYRIRIEEQAMAERFGAQYREYARRTKRLIPFVF